MVFLYTGIEESEIKFRKFYIHNSIKRTKYRGINLTKEVQDLCGENYKTLLKEVKDLNKQIDIPW